MAKPILSDQDYGGVARITNLPDPTAAQHAATKNYVDGAVEGLSWKDSVRTASVANINLAAPGANIDAIAMAANDRFLAKDQAAPTENGIYIWNGAATPATRANDANVFAELEAATVMVEEGTANAGTNWRQTQTNGVIGVNNVAWTVVLPGAPQASETVQGIAEIATNAETDAGVDDLRMLTPKKLKESKIFNKSFAGTIGDGASTSFNLDHNLNTRDVIVRICKTSGNYDDVECDITRPTVNRVTVTFAAAPALNSLRAVIQGTQN